ncbi:TPA: hypothetical protein HA338_08360 [Methanosarcina acetivorans]|uniref:Uncharacterized protein n=2 Tax=Methanosarcina acetivorans TaxID=2214 RepID=Q8TP50_METAC|nr:hypothetical protein [Methanosarcina acetivorans]AAM05470.1 predicted protein [Methanosarcina acetivorans C2A]HIH94040.1 hypothetical protein [Methanosarcina acetivorans]
MTQLKILFADDEIPDRKSVGDDLGKEIPYEKVLEDELKKPINSKKYSLWRHKKALDDISKLTVANSYKDAIKLAEDKEQQFDIAIIDLHWNDYKENKNAGFEICEKLEENSQAFKIVYSTRLNENPELRKKIIDLNALPLHKIYTNRIDDKQIEKSCDQLKSVVLFFEMIKDQGTYLTITERKTKIKGLDASLSESSDILKISKNQQKWYFRVMIALWTFFIIYFFYQISTTGLSDEITFVFDVFTVLVGSILYKLISSNQENIMKILEERQTIVRQLRD